MSLETFVSDNLLAHLGTSDSATVQYFIALGKLPTAPSLSVQADLLSPFSPTTATSSKSPGALLSTLTYNGLPSTPQVESFASQLYSRAPRKAPAAGHSAKAKANAEEARKKAEKERQAMQKQRFSLVLEDEVEPSGSGGDKRSSSKNDKSKSSSSKKEKSSLRKRGDGGDAWESDEEERSAKRRREEERWAREDASRAARKDDGAAPEGPEEDEDPATRAERERLADLKERDEFAARMRDREKERTKAKGVVEDTSAESVARRALAKDPTALENAMPSLRDRSRQSYLGKREQQQLDLLRMEIAEDERDFRGVKLTRREREELDRKKELLRLAEERLAVDEGFDGYQMPDGEFGDRLGLRNPDAH